MLYILAVAHVAMVRPTLDFYNCLDFFNRSHLGWLPLHHASPDGREISVCCLPIQEVLVSIFLAPIGAQCMQSSVRLSYLVS